MASSKNIHTSNGLCFKIYVFAYMHVAVSAKETINLKENKQGYMRGFKVGNQKGETM